MSPKNLHLVAEIDAALIRLEDAKRVKAQADTSFTEAEQTYLELVEKARAEGLLPKIKTRPIVATNGTTLKATLVDGHGKLATLDHLKLEKKLGKRRWMQVTVPVLDKGLLDAALDSGLVKAAEVEACTEFTDKKSYVRFTVDTKAITKVTTGSRLKPAKVEPLRPAPAKVIRRPKGMGK